jgi:hypothetical protein
MAQSSCQQFHVQQILHTSLLVYFVVAKLTAGMLRYFSSWSALAVSTSPCQLPKLRCADNSSSLTGAKRAEAWTHKEYPCFPTWSLERLIRNMHELIKNLRWNKGSDAISVHSNGVFSYLFTNVCNQQFIRGVGARTWCYGSIAWNACLPYKHTNKRLLAPRTQKPSTIKAKLTELNAIDL